MRPATPRWGAWLSQDRPESTDTASKPGLVDRLKARYQRLRDRVPLLDHLARALEHSSAAQASMLSGAVTYFGLLSFFPIVALVYAVLGFVVGRYPEAQEPVLDALQSVLPGIFDQLGTEQIADAAATASVIGVVGFLYSGLGWLSSLRTALQTVFAVPKAQRGNFLVGKVRDLMVLGVLGLVLLVSVASSSLVTTLAGDLLDAIGLEDVPGASVLLRAVGIVIGIGASTVLFFVIFRLLGRPEAPWTRASRGCTGSGDRLRGAQAARHVRDREHDRQPDLRTVRARHRAARVDQLLRAAHHDRRVVGGDHAAGRRGRHDADGP